MHVYFCSIVKVPEKIYRANKKIERDDKFVYFVAATSEEEAQDMTLFFFKEEHKLHTPYHNVSLYVEEVEFETYRCPLTLEDINEQKYRMDFVPVKNKLFHDANCKKAIACA